MGHQQIKFHKMTHPMAFSPPDIVPQAYQFQLASLRVQEPAMTNFCCTEPNSLTFIEKIRKQKSRKVKHLKITSSNQFSPSKKLLREIFGLLAFQACVDFSVCFVPFRRIRGHKSGFLQLNCNLLIRFGLIVSPF